jgi:hypothetical protein
MILKKPIICVNFQMTPKLELMFFLFDFRICVEIYEKLNDLKSNFEV